ncbi:MAG: FtsH protease activity modulator HflK [Acidobacteriota bacterium]|nr:FtsH protease activity modulator HflK [Acidobacteriota bacterium]
MALYDSPGGNGPWSGLGGEQPGLPDLEGLLRRFGGNARRMVLRVAVGLGVVILFFTSVYSIQPDEAGVVTRFGRYARVTDPGLHFLLPFLETVTKVPVERQLKEEFGFRTVEAGVRTAYDQRQFLEESLMLTGDLNVAVVEWIVQYKVQDPRAYLFNVREIRSTFRDMSEAAMRDVVGDHSVDEVLTVGRERIAARAKDLLQEMNDRYETGISVQQLVLQDVNPPDSVKPSFNEVNEAIQEKERLTNEALAEYNQAIPRARGDAERVIQEAEGYAAERVNRARGEAARFEAVYAEYRNAPRVTRSRMYLETLSEVMPKLGQKVILDESGANILPLLNLNGQRQPSANPGDPGSARQPEREESK